MKAPPNGARTDLAVLYNGKWRRPGARGTRPLWVLRVSAGDVACYDARTPRV